MKTYFLGFTLLLFTSSCFSKLKVNVQIANRDELLKEYEKIKMSPMAEFLVYQEFLESIRPEKLSEKIADEIQKTSNPPLDSEFAKKIAGDIEKKISQKLKGDFDEISSYIEEISSKKGRGEIEITDEQLLKLKFEVQSVIQKINDYERDLKKDIDSKISIEDYKAYLVYQNFVAKKENSISQIERTRFPILGDPLASFVVKDRKGEENRKFWTGKFNQTKSRNFFGNSDIAVLLRSSPPEKELKSGDYNNNFTIKGVRLDASDVTNAFVNSLTQTINFIGQTQGLSIPNGTATQGDFSVVNPVSNPDALLLESRKYELQEIQSNSRKVRDLMLRKLLDLNLESLEGEELNQYIANIDSYWNNLRTILNKTNNETTSF